MGKAKGERHFLCARIRRPRSIDIPIYLQCAKVLSNMVFITFFWCFRTSNQDRRGVVSKPSDIFFSYDFLNPVNFS